MKFKQGLAWTAGGQASFFILQFGGSVIVARLLSPYEMGVYGLAVAIVGVINLIQSVGLGSYIVREPDLTAERLATAFTINAAISLGLAAVTAGLGAASTAVTSDAGVRGCLLVLALTPLLGIISIVPSSLLEREGDFRIISIGNMVRSLMASLLTVMLAYRGWSYYSVAWGQVGASIVSTSVVCVLARRHLRWRMSLAQWRQISKFSTQMIAISGVNTLAARASDLLLGKFTGLAGLGLYNRAANVNNLFWENLHLVMGRNVFSELARIKREGQSLRSFYLSVSEMVTAFLWPVFTGLAVLAEPLIRLVYGDQWAAAAPAFALLALSSVVNLSITMTWEVFVACGETGRQARIEFIRTGLGVVLFAIGCSISLEAAAGARVLETLFSMLLYRPHLERMTDTSLRDSGPIYLRSGLLTLLAVLPASLLMMYSGSDASHLPFLTMLIAVLIGAALWSLGLLLMRHPIVEQVRGLLKSRRQFA